MITKPSISGLVTGLIQNFEKLLDQESGDVRQMLVPALSVLDRVGSEWHSWCALLEADNEDIRQTLLHVGVTLPPAVSTLPTFTGRDSLHRVEELEQDNRVLKDTLVAAIEQLDLPAAVDAPAGIRQKDEAVLGLLRRMLYREDSVQVPAARSASTSGNPANAVLPLDSLQEVLDRFLAAQMPDATHITIAQLQPLSGGASREAWIFDVAWQQGGAQHTEACILMREPIASVLVSDESATVINGTRRTVENEIRVIRAMEQAGLPVPTVLWQDAQGEWLERPFSIARRLPGTADAGQIDTAHLQTLLTQYVDILAQIHQLDPAQIQVDFLGRPSADNAALAQVEQFEYNFESQRLEAFPATTYIIRWLKKHAPQAGRVSVVHGDYRLGNFLFEADRMIAILDWEQVHIGDPVEEIAFMYWSLWSLEGLCPIEKFVSRYERATGTRVDRQALAYYRVFIEFKMLVVLFTGLKSYFATPEYQLHYGSAQTVEMIRDSQLRVIEALHHGGPTVAFDAYQKMT